MPTPRNETSERSEDIRRVRILSRSEPALPRLRILQSSGSTTRSVRTGFSLALASAPTRRFRLSNLWSNQVETLKAAVAKTVRPSAREDYKWFYSDPIRARAFAGLVVAVSGAQIVGSGTANEAANQARLAGVSSPLLIRVLLPEERAKNQAGL